MHGFLPDVKRLAIVVPILLVSFLTGCSDPTTARPPEHPKPKERPARQTVTQRKQPDKAPTRREQMLVDREQLEEMLGRPNVRIVDTRPVDEYLAGHVPGAVRLDVADWQKRALEEGGLEDADYWAEAVGGLGIDNDMTVVVYGNSPTTTARVWWHLAYAGVKQPMLLDGGWDLWKVGGKPTEMEPATPEPAPFKPKLDKSLLMTKEQLKQALGGSAEKVVVLDTRSEDEFTGREARGGRGGHLPGAVHCEWAEMLDANGRFKSNEELRSLFVERGVSPDDNLVTHCQSGGRASVELFALRLAGFENVANFYGGWSQWSQDEEAPVEK